MPEIDFPPKVCGIVDERSEIAAMYRGVPQNDIGMFSDVIDNVPKYIGINMLIRSMAPEIIVCDEIGGNEDIGAIEKMALSGVKGIFTAHGGSIEEIYQNENLKRLIDSKIIRKIIILDSKQKGKIKETIDVLK